MFVFIDESGIHKEVEHSTFVLVYVEVDDHDEIAVVKNPVSSSRELEKALVHMLVERGVSSVFIDGRKPKWYERKIKKVLRDKGMPVKKLRTVSSRQYPGIRLADLVAGLSRAHFDGRNAERIEKYYRRLEKKTIIVIG